MSNQASENIKRSWAPESDRVPIARKPPRYPVRAWSEIYGYEAPIPSAATKQTAIAAMKNVDSRGDAGARRVAAIQGVIRTGKKDAALAIKHRCEK